MNDLAGVLAEAQQRIPDCVAVGLVELSTGRLLGAKTAEDPDALEAASRAAGGLFQGPNVASIEQLFKRRRAIADEGQPHFHEVIVFSEVSIHVFQRARARTDVVLVTVCRTSANLGLVLAETRASLSAAESVA